MFAANTDNFFVVNDRQVSSGAVDVVLAAPGIAVQAAARRDPDRGAEHARHRASRTLVASSRRLNELDEARRRFSCGPLS